MAGTARLDHLAHSYKALGDGTGGRLCVGVGSRYRVSAREITKRDIGVGSALTPCCSDLPRVDREFMGLQNLEKELCIKSLLSALCG